jgi:hypothetical protein
MKARKLSPALQPLEPRLLMAGGVKPLPPVHSPGPSIVLTIIVPGPKPITK